MPNNQNHDLLEVRSHSLLNVGTRIIISVQLSLVG